MIGITLSLVLYSHFYAWSRNVNNISLNFYAWSRNVNNILIIQRPIFEAIPVTRDMQVICLIVSVAFERTIVLVVFDGTIVSVTFDGTINSVSFDGTTASVAVTNLLRFLYFELMQHFRQ